MLSRKFFKKIIVRNKCYTDPVVDVVGSSNVRCKQSIWKAYMTTPFLMYIQSHMEHHFTLLELRPLNNTIYFEHGTAVTTRLGALGQPIFFVRFLSRGWKECPKTEKGPESLLLKRLVILTTGNFKKLNTLSYWQVTLTSKI